jgi:hypothetical protein
MKLGLLIIVSAAISRSELNGILVRNNEQILLPYP